MRLRRNVKQVLGAWPSLGAARGATLLIYHRVGGGTTNELDVSRDAFRNQVEILTRHDVVSLDAALDRLDSGDQRPGFVLTFDDGFADVYHHAWPLLRERSMPFTVYLATAYMGTTMRWEGSTAKGTAGQGMTWEQLAELVDSGLCTIGNHTHNHVRPQELTVGELDECTATVESRLGITPRHFTYPWGIKVPDLEDQLRVRFRSASTGELGRNLPAADRMRLRRVPVRRTDPDSFFRAKLTGGLGAERWYAAMVDVAKTVLRPQG